MRRRALLLLGLGFGAACSSFDAAPGTEPGGTPPINGGDSGVGAADVFVEPDVVPLPDGTLPLAPIVPMTGSSCVERTQLYATCLDFEPPNGITVSATSRGTISSGPPGSSSDNAVIAEAKSSNMPGEAFKVLSIPCTARVVSWAFDLFIDDKLHDTTELNQLFIDRATVSASAIQIRREGTFLEVIDYMASVVQTPEVSLARFSLEGAEGQWVTMMISADFNQRRVTTGLRTPRGLSMGPLAQMRQSTLSERCEIQLGINYVYEQAGGSIALIDNFAWSAR